MTERERDIILVLGKTGMGKTQWTRRYLLDQRRVIIIDPIEEYHGAMFDDLEKMVEFMQRYQTWTVSTSRVDQLEMICRIGMAFGNCIVVVEEAQRVLPRSFMIEEDSPMGDIIFRGRHSRVSFLAVSQRPSTINIVVRSQWTRIITFNQAEITDTKWIRGTSGFPLPNLEKLPVFHHYDITPSTQEIKIIDMPGRRGKIKLWDDRPMPVGSDATAPERG